MRRARTAEEYVEMIRQARFEIDDLRACLEYESEENMSSFPAFLQDLDNGLNALYQAMEQGSYHWGSEDLDFMPIVKKHELQIPFSQLLEAINRTHRQGLDLDGVEDTVKI